MREVVFHDEVLEQIDDFVARHQPERGGILLGPVGLPVVSEFIPDPDAVTTGTTYSPSPQVGIKVDAATHGNNEVKGVVHSHPSGMDHPSHGDRGSFLNWMRRMPWIPALITPIVTVGQDRRGRESHKIELAHGEMSVFIAEKRVNDQLAVLKAHPRVLPIARSVADVGGAFEAQSVSSRTSYVPVDGHMYASTTLRDSNGELITLLMPYTLPLQPPLILAPKHGQNRSRTGADTIAVPLTWDVGVPADERLAHALRLLDRSLSGQATPPSRSIEPTKAEGDSSDRIRAGLRARLDGSVASSVREATVLVVGLGSGGSQTVEALARSSVENFVVMDPDSVEAANLSRSIYDAIDIGETKCAAITRRLQAINPAVTVTAHPNALNELTPNHLATLIDAVDYVVAATDDPEAQYRLNHVAWQRGRPAVFAGVYERGAAGEIVFTIPGATACFRCATAGRRGGRRGATLLDYGTGTLAAEPALGADITHVVSTSVKILLGLIELSDPEAHRNSAASLVASAAAAGRNYLQMSMVPEYDYFPTVFDGVAGQHAYQSVWLETHSAHDCPTCGEAPRTDTLATSVNVGALRPVDDLVVTARTNPRETTEPNVSDLSASGNAGGDG